MVHDLGLINGASLRTRRKPTLKNACLDEVGRLVLHGKIQLSSLQQLGGDIMEQLYHHLHCAKQLSSPELIFALVTPYLHTLHLALCFFLTDDHLEALLRKCTQLHEINLSACHKVTVKGIEMIGKLCPQLESLNIANGHTITSNAIHSIINDCPNIHSLNFASCWAMDDTVLAHLGTIRHQLQYVNLCGCKLISKVGISNMLGNDSLGVTQPNCCNTCPLLHTLYLSNCKPDITTPSIKEIAAAAPNLTSLNIGSIKTVEDSAIISLANSCNRLQELLASWCPITDQAISALAPKCVNLQVLNLSGCNRIADLTCASLSENCHQLRKINLSSTRITFGAITKLIENSPDLKSVDIRLCGNITQEEKERLKGYLIHVKY